MTPKMPKHQFFTLNLFLRLTLFVTMFVVVFTFALTSISGYKIDFKNINLSPASMIQVSTVPAGAVTSINDQPLPFFANNRVSVVNGHHKVKVSRDGFYEWQTVLPIKARTIWWVDARLVPKVKRVATVKTYDSLLASYASPDRKWLLNHLSSGLFELVDLRSERPVYRLIDFKTILQATLVDQELVFYDWNLANDAMFFRDKISGKLYLVGMSNRSYLIDLTTSYPTLSFDQVKVGGDGGKTMYVLSKQELHRINLDRLGSTSKIVSGVISYQAINRNQVVLTQGAPIGANYKTAVAIYDGNKERLIEFDRITSDSPVFFEAFDSRYDGYFYIALYCDHKFRVWRGNLAELNPPMEQTANNSQTVEESLALQRFKAANPSFRDYFSVYLENHPKNIFVGGDGRLVVIDKGTITLSDIDRQKLVDDLAKVKDGSALTIAAAQPVTVNQMLVFDTNYRMNYTVSLALGVGSTAAAETKASPNWLSNEILWENLMGVVRIKDFNGQNQHKLIPADARYDIQLSANDKYVYFYQIIDNLPVLRRLQMTDF